MEDFKTWRLNEAMDPMLKASTWKMMDWEQIQMFVVQGAKTDSPEQRQKVIDGLERQIQYRAIQIDTIKEYLEALRAK
jgi:transcriptional regulator NrdR family protein